MIFMEISRSIRKQTKEEMEKKDARIEYLEVSLIVGLILAPIDTLLICCIILHCLYTSALFVNIKFIVITESLVCPEF